MASHIVRPKGAAGSNVAWCVAGGVALGAAAVLAVQAIRKAVSGARPASPEADAGAKAAAVRGAFLSGTAPSGEVVNNHATESHFEYPRDTRREERWPEDSPEYKAGHARHNRVKPPPKEIEGDVFDRQRCIVGFDQGLIEKQTCLVLGTGGIGQNVALTLARLGVKKIIMLDCDTYDASNLTRQCLGTPADVGRRKVDVAADNIRYHNLRSEIQTVHCDALASWPKVVELARQCDVMFNAIDVGSVWDLCVNALGQELRIPTVAGQSYDWTWDVEFYSNKPGQRCSRCNTSLKAFEDWLHAEAIHFGAKDDRDRTAMLDRMFPEGGRPALNADGILAFLSADQDFRLNGETARTIVQASIASAVGGAGGASAGAGVGVGVGAGGAGAGGGASINREQAPAFFEAFFRHCMTRMMPGQIGQQKDLSFIPRPAHVDTRFVGSWVCVCLAASCHMVSQWVANLLQPNGIRYDLHTPSSCTMVLGIGATATECGYEEELQMAKQGIMAVDQLLKVPRFFADGKSADFCGHCAVAQGTPVAEVIRL